MKRFPLHVWLLCLAATIVGVAQQQRASALDATAYSYDFCDPDYDGLVQIPLDMIAQEVLENEIPEFGYEEAIWISDSNGKVNKVTDLEGSPDITTYCQLNSSWGLMDIALNQSAEVFVCSEQHIWKIQPSDCAILDNTTGVFNGWVNSLSFDPDQNLYYGGESTKVYRLEQGDLSQPPIVWHDFESGIAAGDFVVLGNKMYIAWLKSDGVHLYEVMVTEDYQFVSYTDKGLLQYNTYGLASELGKLYGVTPNLLYRINPMDMTFTDILENDSSASWYGAAGQNEAIRFDIALYENLADLAAGSPEISGYWYNTVPGGQTIYAALTDLSNANVEIIPIQLTVHLPPVPGTPQNTGHCEGPGAEIFQLDAFTPQLIGNQTDVLLSYHNNSIDAAQNLNPLDNTITVSGLRNIYVRLEFGTTGCYTIYNFFLSIKQPPVPATLAPIPLCQSGTAAIPVDLSDYETSIMPAATSDYQFTYFAAEADAQLDFPTIAPQQALIQDSRFYFRVTDANGCHSVGYLDFTLSTIDTNPELTLEFEVREWTDSENTIRVLPQPMQNGQEFALDSGDFTEDPLFDGLRPGVYRVSVRNFNAPDCYETSRQVVVKMYPRFFTPNLDGYNDGWNIKFASYDRQMRIRIFDRFGRLLASIDPSGPGWDGTFQGKAVPSDDYWFTAEPSTGNSVRGHFTLKR